jgi:hypothetical protein
MRYILLAFILVGTTVAQSIQDPELRTLIIEYNKTRAKPHPPRNSDSPGEEALRKRLVELYWEEDDQILLGDLRNYTQIEPTNWGRQSELLQSKGLASLLSASGLAGIETIPYGSLKGRGVILYLYRVRNGLLERKTRHLGPIKRYDKADEWSVLIGRKGRTFTSLDEFRPAP